jgi:hypothetical protein
MMWPVDRIYDGIDDLADDEIRPLPFMPVIVRIWRHGTSGRHGSDPYFTGGIRGQVSLSRNLWLAEELYLTMEISFPKWMNSFCVEKGQLSRSSLSF